MNINSNSFNATLLANYYLNAEGGSLNAVAKNAAGVDFVAMQNTINITISDTITVHHLLLSCQTLNFCVVISVSSPACLIAAVNIL